GRGAPVPLGASLIAVVLLARARGRRRHLPAGRARLVLVLLPAVVALTPLLVHAAGTDHGWRVLFADPGAPLPSDPGDAWLQLLGWPEEPVASTLLPAAVAPWAPLAGAAVILLGAVAALFRGAGRARSVRIGWLVAVVGLVAALVGSRWPSASAAAATAPTRWCTAGPAPAPPWCSPGCWSPCSAPPTVCAAPSVTPTSAGGRSAPPWRPWWCSSRSPSAPPATPRTRWQSAPAPPTATCCRSAPAAPAPCPPW